MIHKLKLTDGTEVELNTSVSLLGLRKFEKKGLITPKMYGSIVKLDDTPAHMGDVVLKEAPLVLYAAYLNADNKGKTMERDEFLDKVPYDMEFCLDIYAEFLTGSKMPNAFAESIEEATEKPKN